jgi:hypothetical protein
MDWAKLHITASDPCEFDYTQVNGWQRPGVALFEVGDFEQFV